MGSSGGGSLRPPNIPAPTGVPISGPGQGIVEPQYVNFLSPGMEASTGITPGMEAQLVDYQKPPAMVPGQGGGGMMAPGDMRAMLAHMMNMRNPLYAGLIGQLPGGRNSNYYGQGISAGGGSQSGGYSTSGGYGGGIGGAYGGNTVGGAFSGSGSGWSGGPGGYGKGWGKGGNTSATGKGGLY